MTAQPVPPFWFGQRQCKLEPLEDGSYRVTGPNLAEAFIGIRPREYGRWAPEFRLAKDGPNLAEADAELATPQEAWDAAFELYRLSLIV
jgi:hypothetical protein